MSHFINCIITIFEALGGLIGVLFTLLFTCANFTGHCLKMGNQITHICNAGRGAASDVVFILLLILIILLILVLFL